MARKLFLLDGMALVYRAHFALIRSPIFTSGGFNASAVFGFANTLVDLLQKQNPTHLAVVFDTPEPTVRHEQFPEYKAQRDEMPEDIRLSIPEVKRMAEAFQIPVIEHPGFEADDVIGTLAKLAEQEGDFEVFMVTSDKDFAQLVSEHIKIYKPGRQGSQVEILGVEEILENWGIERVGQVVDILGLWGDASDNIPGVPGIGEKTAKKLIAKYGSVEHLLESVDELKGKQKENLENFADQARLSKELVRIITEVPVKVGLDELVVRGVNEDALKSFLVEFEFNSLGKRLFGKDFQAGRGFEAGKRKGKKDGKTAGSGEGAPEGEAAGSDRSDTKKDATSREDSSSGAVLMTINDVSHDYMLVTGDEERADLVRILSKKKSFCFDVETTGLKPAESRLLGIAFSWKAGSGFYVAFPNDEEGAARVLKELKPLFLNAGAEKVGHNLKFDLSVLLWNGIEALGPFFDTMIAHAIVEPGRRHTMNHLAEELLGYTPITYEQAMAGGGEGDGQMDMMLAPSRKDLERMADYASEDADVTWQLAEKLRPMIQAHHQERVFHEIECPLIPVIAAMEFEGISLDTDALAVIGEELATNIETLRLSIREEAGIDFNLNSPKQLGEILFDRLKLVEKPKKTKTGQYVTNEQVLTTLASKHKIVADILAYREASKLKSTYVDALPRSVLPRTGRVHTSFHQIMTATGRLASSDPNLQNIPVRSAQGREIRKAFVPRSKDEVLLSADYSQVELRVMAHLSGDPAMREAFQQGLDIHTATAARVFGKDLDEVSRDMRSTAKMVNFGIIYGISAFGLSQRLGIPRGEAKTIIEEYLKQYSGVEAYMKHTIEEAKANGYVETITGRRRYFRDINSANNMLQKRAEREAINTPIQGTAADMIKIAMVRVHDALGKAKVRSRMLLQVHDELLFDLHREEQEQVVPLVVDAMKNAIPMDVPIVVDTGTGDNWLEAH